ncbi:MAG TPA: hypothetical protein VM513_12410 [Kofleriaceae bacterium]|nr:hypothetical protein [Kofleriaceae bacterium]
MPRASTASFGASENPGERASFPSLAVDGDAVHVTWELYSDRDAEPRGLAHVMSTDGGDTFTPPYEVPGSADPDGGANGSFQGRLMRKLAVHDGEVAIVNSTLLLGRSSRVWLVRGTAREATTGRQRSV